MHPNLGLIGLWLFTCHMHNHYMPPMPLMSPVDVPCWWLCAVGNPMPIYDI